MRRDVFQAIADPTRREIINLIAYKSLNLNSIAGNFGVSRPAISQHIKILTECGLIVIKKQGRERYCEASLQPLNEVSVWVEQYRKLWAERFDVIDDLLKELKAAPAISGASEAAAIGKQKMPLRKKPKNHNTLTFIAMNSTLKSIGAVLAGMILIVVLSVATDTILESRNIFPPQNQPGLYSTWMLAVALLYRSLFGITGGYLTASLSLANPVKHAIILGIIGTVVSIIGVVVMWNASENWYPIALAATALPTTWLGAKLKMGFSFAADDTDK